MSRELDAKVAEALGWDLSPFSDCPGQIAEKGIDTMRVIRTVPSYSTDATATFEMEDTLARHAWYDYISALCSVCGVDEQSFAYDTVPRWLYYDGLWALIHATSEERCRAFLKTKESI